jgi:DNA-binding MarR family transcriptional regulator
MDTPADCVCFRLRRAARAASRAYDELLAPSGIRVTQFSLLSVLNSLGPLTVTELAEVAVMERTTLTRNLRVLERQNLVARKPGQDRRQRVISLSKHGRATLKAATPLWREAQKRMVAGLGAPRKQRLLRDLAFTAEL